MKSLPKNLFAVILAAGLALGLTACSNNDLPQVSTFKASLKVQNSVMKDAVASVPKAKVASTQSVSADKAGAVTCDKDKSQQLSSTTVYTKNLDLTAFMKTLQSKYEADGWTASKYSKSGVNKLVLDKGQFELWVGKYTNTTTKQAGVQFVAFGACLASSK